MATNCSSPAIPNEINELPQLRLCDGRQHRRCGRQRCRPGLALLLCCMLLLPWKGACYKRAIATYAILHSWGALCCHWGQPYMFLRLLHCTQEV